MHQDHTGIMCKVVGPGELHQHYYERMRKCSALLIAIENLLRKKYCWQTENVGLLFVVFFPLRLS